MSKGKSVKFLFLSEEDMIEAGVLNMGECIETMIEQFKVLAEGDYLFGGPSHHSHGIRLQFPESTKFPNMPVAGPDRRFLAMIGYLGGNFNVCGEKWYGSNIANPSKGLPRSILNIILNDTDTSEPLTFCSANLISAMRTGAIPGVGAKYLARPDSKVVGIVAAGVISKACLMSYPHVLKNIKEVKVFDINKEKSQIFCEEMKNMLNLDVHPVNSMEEAIVGSDVINVAASGKVLPYIKTEWVKKGAYLGLPAGIEFDEEFLLNVAGKVAIDLWEMHIVNRQEADEAGAKVVLGTRYIYDYIKEGKMTTEDILQIGDLVTGVKPGRESEEEITVCITGGLPSEDLAWAYRVYQSALKKGIGTELKLWESPHWF